MPEFPALSLPAVFKNDIVLPFIGALAIGRRLADEMRVEGSGAKLQPKLILNLLRVSQTATSTPLFQHMCDSRFLSSLGWRTRGPDK